MRATSKFIYSKENEWYLVKKRTFLKKNDCGDSFTIVSRMLFVWWKAVHANQANNGSLARGDDYPIIIKWKSKKLINGVYTPDSVHLCCLSIK